MFAIHGSGATLSGDAPVAHKVCPRCNLRKYADGFSRNKARADGMCIYCKPCNAAASAERRRAHVPVTAPTVTHKVCGQCKRDLPSAKFHRSKGCKDGLTGKCKECSAAIITQRKADLLESVRRSSDDSSDSRQLVNPSEALCTRGDVAHGSKGSLARVSADSGSSGDADSEPSALPCRQQVEPNAMQTVQRDDGALAVKRRRLELDTRIDIVRAHSAPLSDVHGADIGQMFGGHQPQQGLTRYFSQASVVPVDFEGDYLAQAPEFSFQGLESLAVAPHGPNEVAEAMFASPDAPPALDSRHHPARDVLGSCMPAEHLYSSAGNAADRSHGPSAHKAARPQYVARPNHMYHTGRMDSGGSPYLSAPWVDVQRLEPSGVMRSSRLAAADTVMAADRGCGTRYRSKAFRARHSCERSTVGGSTKAFADYHGLEVPVRPLLQEVPSLPHSRSPFQPPLDVLQMRPLERPCEQCHQTSAPSAMQAPTACKRGAPELQRAVDLRPITAGGTALQRLLGGPLQPAVLSARAAAAFPALALTLGVH